MNTPNGKVTFLFTDIEGSTKLSQDFPDSVHATMQRHNSILKKAIESNKGFIFEIVGDAFCSAFENAEDAVKAAVEIQKSLTDEKWEDTPVKVRIGIHSGMAEWNGSQYMGYITLARTQRLMSAAHGEQILISDEAYQRASDNLPGTVSFRDLGVRRLKDLVQPMKLYHIVSPDLPAEFPPLKTLDARPNNLPVQLTNFIGREKEMAEIRKLISEKKLVTLIGPGGTGKTRLALQIGADVIDEFSNGVWITELAPLKEPGLIPLTIAKTLNVNEQPNEEIEVTLINYLKDKEILIILDNCEHLIEACAQIAESLLQNCPRLKIITTSREALRSEGEVTHKVLSLEHPELSETNTPFELSQFEAVRLFIERALAVNPNFRVNNENAPALAQICFHLDGIPLAIELAAARINVISVEKICDKLNDRFKLLTGGKRTALPRQQTLKALIDWSYDLLTDNEKKLFQRLSVFSGSWSLEAAEEICSDDELDTYEIIDIQTNLIDKSLISTTEVNGSMRFRMLETVREYSKEKLGINLGLKQMHLQYFRRLADYEKMTSEEMTQLEWVKMIQADTDNIRAAIQKAIDTDPDEAVDFIDDISKYWNIKGYFKEGLNTVLQFLERNPSVSGESRAKILVCAGSQSMGLGNMVDMEKYARESLSIYRASGEKKGVASSLDLLGCALNLHLGTENEVLEYYNEALSIFRELGLKHRAASTLYNMSFPLMRLGKSEQGLNSRKEALAIFKELNDTEQITLIMTSLGVHEYNSNNFEIAKKYSEESLANSKLLGDNYLISINLINLGCIYTSLKEYEKAYSLLEESIAILKEYGFKSSLLAALMYLGEVSSKLDEEEKAIKLIKESIQMAVNTGIDFFMEYNLYLLGISYFKLKNYDLSVKYFSFQKAYSESYTNPRSPKAMKCIDDYRLRLKEILGEEKYDKSVNEALRMSKEKIFEFSLNGL